MGIDNEFMKLIGTQQQQGMSDAQAKLLNSLIDNSRDPLFISELKSPEIAPYIACQSFANIYGLELYKKFLVVFLRGKIPLDRKRVNELLKGIKNDSEVEKKSLWERITNK